MKVLNWYRQIKTFVDIDANVNVWWCVCVSPFENLAVFGSNHPNVWQQPSHIFRIIYLYIYISLYIYKSYIYILYILYIYSIYSDTEFWWERLKWPDVDPNNRVTSISVGQERPWNAPQVPASASRGFVPIELLQLGIVNSSLWIALKWATFFRSFTSCKWLWMAWNNWGYHSINGLILVTKITGIVISGWLVDDELGDENLPFIYLFIYMGKL
jgi:hypothetical protein